MRIRILVRLCRHKKLYFDLKNIFYVSNMSKNIPTQVKKPFWKAGNPILLIILLKFLAPGSGSGPAFPTRIRIQESQLNLDLRESGSGSKTPFETHQFSRPQGNILSLNPTALLAKSLDWNVTKTTLKHGLYFICHIFLCRSVVPQFIEIFVWKSTCHDAAKMRWIRDITYTFFAIYVKISY